MGVPPPVGQAGARSATGGALRAAEADLSRRMTDPCNPTRPASTSTRDPVIPLAKQRRSILNKLRPIENAYANMHPECALHSPKQCLMVSAASGSIGAAK